MPKLRIETQQDSWRLRCPNGHNVAPVNDHWYCRSCANFWAGNVDPEYEFAIDQKTGRELRRDDVEINFDVPGVYYA